MKRWGELGIEEPFIAHDEIIAIAGRRISDQRRVTMSMNSLGKSMKDMYTTDGMFDERRTVLGSMTDMDGGASNYQTVEWSCSECTFRNSYERDDCEMCDKPRPEIGEDEAELDEEDDDEILPDSQLLSSRIVLKVRY